MKTRIVAIALGSAIGVAGWLASSGHAQRPQAPIAPRALAAAQGFPAGQQELAYLLLENDPSPADVKRA